MNPTDPHLPAALDAAINRVKATVVTVAERVAVLLGNQAQVATRIFERDQLLAGHLDLRRKMNSFHLAVAESLITQIKKEITPKADARRKSAIDDWQSLTLVEDNEVEERMLAERIGQQIMHACEWELREVASYMGAVLGHGRADEDRNPLRSEVIGTAIFKGVDAVSDDADIRKLLAKEFATAMAQSMPDCYKGMIEEFKARHLRPVTMSLKQVEGPGYAVGGGNSGYESVRGDLRSTRAGGDTDFGDSGIADAMGPQGFGGAPGSGGSAGGQSTRGGAPGAGGFAPGAGPGGASGTGGGAGGGYAPGGAGSGYVPGGAGSGHGPGGPGAGRSAASGPGVAAAERARGPAPRHVPVAHRGSGLRGDTNARISAEADAQMMALLRRLTYLASRPGGLEPGQTGNSGFGATGGLGGSTRANGLSSGPASLRGADSGLNGAADAAASDMAGLMAVNLIRAHREELLKASTGKLDHMVIDVVGSLFDQILSDPRVPPQMARQIARLQLPVLRVALVDESFFSSRRHPVRRFVNRIGSLACAFDDFTESPGKDLLAQVKVLVQQIVEGDFDQIDIYSDKLAELEAFTNQQTAAEVQKNGTATILESKESELRVHQRYRQKLQMALEGVPVPAFLSEFISQVLSQALVSATRRDGADGDRTKRFRQVGRDIVLSVQPKGSPAMRKRFLMQLPTLMKDLNEGLKLVGWPDTAQKEFLGKLLPAHAESLKAPPISELDHNLLAKQLEAVFVQPIPSADDFVRVESVTLPGQEIEQRFSPEEARQIGLVEENEIDWTGDIDIDITSDTPGATDSPPHIAAFSPSTSEPATTDSPATAPGALPPETSQDTSPDSLPMPEGIDINLDLVNADPTEPTRGAQLVDHVKIGFAYQMLLKDQWQKVRLSYVSPGRSFFVFTRGKKHQETISLTSRMLARMCESNRLRALESAYLMERATARARRQLAALTASSKH